jgi:uncharacterized lipoprotein YddW (UPF0748 family)
MIQSRIPILILLLALVCPEKADSGSPVGVKGLWVVRYSLNSPQNVRKIAEQAEEAGITDLFVQFYAKGEAYYPSRVAPSVPVVTGSFDPLKLMVKECKQRGIRIHAWINVYFVWSSDQRPSSPKHAYYRGSRWFAADAGGRSLKDYSQWELTKNGLEGVYLSPACPDVKAYIRSLVQEIILRYDVDGIHLDYVRYGHIDFSYDPSSRLGFYQAYTVDPVRFFDGDPRLRSYWDAWYRWRLHQITELVAWIKNDIATASPWVKLSAAVKPDPDEARLGFGQDWPNWLASGWLDFAVLMDYSPDAKAVVRLAQKAYRYKGRGDIYIGLGAWRDSPEGIVDKALQLRRLGMDNIVLFSYDGLAERKIDLVRLRQMGF